MLTLSTTPVRSLVSISIQRSKPTLPQLVCIPQGVSVVTQHATHQQMAGQLVTPQRIRPLVQPPSGARQPAGPAIYWMSRDQRVHDNWALLLAAEHAHKKDVPVAVAL